MSKFGKTRTKTTLRTPIDGFDDGCPDNDNDGIGDPYDPDDDNDLVLDIDDNCPNVPNGLSEAGVPGVGDQTNSDFDLNAAGAAFDSVALPGDADGDGCDDDDDNDSFNGATLLTQFPGAAAVTCPGGSVTRSAG